MNFRYKIVLILTLSFSLPIGRLFEIFIWNDRITKTESIFQAKRLGKKRRSCYFIKIAKEYYAKIYFDFKRKHDYVIREIYQNIIISHTLFIQNKQFDGFKNHLKRILIFNIIYLDETDVESHNFIL